MELFALERWEILKYCYNVILNIKWKHCVGTNIFKVICTGNDWNILRQLMELMWHMFT